MILPAILFSSVHAQTSTEAVRQMSIDDAIRLSVGQNYLVAAAKSDALAAHDAARSASAKRLPSLAANGFATSGSYGSIYSSGAGVDPATSLLVPDGTLLDANLTLMAPLFTGGQLEAQVRSARQLEKAALQDLREAQGDAALRAEDAYFRSLLAREKVKAAGARVEASVEIVRTSKSLFDSGQGIEASVRRAEAELAESQRALAMAEGESEKALLDLRAETGLGLSESISLSDPLDAAVPTKELQAALLEAMANRGTVLASKARVEAAKDDVQSTEGRQRAQVYGVVMADGSNQEANRGATVGLTVNFPVYDGGAHRAEISRARSLIDKASALQRLAEITAQKEVRQAFIDLATAEANVKSSRSSVESAKAAYDVAALRLANGKGILVEQLDALQSLTQAKADLATSLYDRRLAYSQIVRATGTTALEVKGK